MFDILSISLTNFRSYYGKHEFTFPSVPGLYSLTGNNLLNPRLTSNDCGKTTLLEAIYWCFYGKTSRGLKAGDIISWGAKTATVTVTAQIGETACTIRRGQSPNSLTLVGTPVTQETLEKTLRLGPDQFTYAVMLPQFGNAFLDLGPTEKLTLFSDIMGLNYWLEKSQAVADLSKGVLEEKAALERQALKAAAKIESAQQSIAEFKTKHADFKAARKNKVTVLQRHLKEADKEIDSLRERIGQNQAALAKIEKKVKAVDIVCPTCRQPLKSDDLRTLQRNAEDFKNDINVALRKLSAADVTQDSIKRQIVEEKSCENPYQTMVESRAAEISNLEREISSIAAKIGETTSEHVAIDFWVSGFKRVRLHLVDTTLRQLEIEINNNLASLGIGDWRITLDVERENKSGSITKGFSVFVHPPNQDKPVRWEAFGGGVTQRLRLAGNLGLANLIMERAGLRSSVEFYDEPSAHMSELGISDLLVALQDRALTEEKRIWIIDHHSLDFAFEGQLTVTKDEKGSRLS